MACSKKSDRGPGYPTPLAAMKGPREEIVYVVCICSNTTNSDRPDYLATIDVDPKSSSFCEVIHRLDMPYVGDELHHTGWNACASCYDNGCAKRNRLILPAFGGGRVYVVDVDTDPRRPKMFKVFEREEIIAKTGLSYPHSTHCLADGNILINAIGDPDGNEKSGFIVIDGKNWEIKGNWEAPGHHTRLGHDYWYQPKFNVLISTELASPRRILNEFHLEDVRNVPGHYGSAINVYDWEKHTLKQTIDLGPDGQIPFEIRFLHEPQKSEGFVNCALSSAMFRFYLKSDGTWDAEKVIQVEPKKVENWILPVMPGFITDLLLSLDDKFLYISNWFHGDIRQYDVTDTRNPKLVGQVFLGGLICKDGNVTVTEDKELEEQPEPLCFENKRIPGGPQMLQLSLDGKRLYVTTSTVSPWDKQFYPDMCKQGSVLLQIDCNTETGGLKLNKNFLVDFGKEPGGPSLAKQTRYPGGDCTSDIYLEKTAHL